jgi:hypothetical protein
MDIINEILERMESSFGKVISCDKGWYPLIEECHTELKAVDPDYKILQIKEKFGGLRYYFESLNADKYPKMHEIVRKYEAKSFTVCEVTGNGGTLHKKASRVKTLSTQIAAAEGFSEC